MTAIERGTERLVVRSGSTTLILERASRKVCLQRRFLFLTRSPLVKSFSEVSEITVRADKDQASGVEFASIAVVMRDGSAWAIPASDRGDATQTVAALKAFMSGA